MIKKIKHFFYSMYQFYLYTNFIAGLTLYRMCTGDRKPLELYGKMMEENGVVFVENK